MLAPPLNRQTPDAASDTATVLLATSAHTPTHGPVPATVNIKELEVMAAVISAIETVVLN